MITAVDLIHKQVKDARETFESTAADIKKSQLHKDPGGKALPLAAAYAHLIFSEDSIVRNLLWGKPPLYQTAWKSKTGASALMPEMGETWATDHAKWAKSLKLDWSQFSRYAKAVYKSTDTYLQTLTPKSLEQELDLGTMGVYTVAHILTSWVIGHAHNLAGEISAIKGVFNSKGYPF